MITARKVELAEIEPLRALFLQETNFQIRYDSCYSRGWTDSYLLSVDGHTVGYGSLWSQAPKDRYTVFEYFVVQPFRRMASALFREFIKASGARAIECQSNELLLTLMLHEFCPSVISEVILFEEHSTTEHVIPGAVFRKKRDGDRMNDQEVRAGYVLEWNGEVVAAGGFLLHYNKPFADLYMETREDHRGRGLATLLLQEVKKERHLAGRVPAARCDIMNLASRAALQKGGLRICGFMMTGEIRRTTSE